MQIRKVIERRIRHRSGGIDVAGDVNAVVSANVGERGTSHSHVSSRQTVVQRSADARSTQERRDDEEET